MGHITNQIRDKEILDFDEPMDDEKRKEKLERLFSEFIVPFADKALSKSGIKELAGKGGITLYTIEQEKVLKALKEKSNRLEEEVNKLMTAR